MSEIVPEHRMAYIMTHEQRMCQHRHNMHLGSCSSARMQMKGIEHSRVVSRQANMMAAKIGDQLKELEVLIRDVRVNSDGTTSKPVYKASVYKEGSF